MPASELPLCLVTPTGIVYDEPVREVNAVNPLGEFGVLPDHINYLTALEPGILVVKKIDGSDHFYLVSGGLVEVKDGAMTVLAQSADRVEDLAAEPNLEQAILEAEEKLHYLSFYDLDYEDAQRGLRMARARQHALTLKENLGRR